MWRTWVLPLLSIMACTAGFAADQGSKPSPAKLDKPMKETDLATITLTEEAVKRLGIATAVIEKRKVERSRTFGGEMIVPGVARTNNAARAQSLVAIMPSLTATDLIRIAELQVDGDGQVDRARVQLDAAKTALQRAEQLLSGKAGSVRGVDEAKAQVALAESALRTANARRELLGPPVLDAMGQKRFWVRVPVYVGDLPKLKSSAEVRVGGLSEAAGASTRPAKPVTAPPSANPGAATVDLFYEVGNEDGALRLGQKVGVTIPLQQTEERLVVPWASILHDIYGNTWVYESTGPQVFVRRRVQVAHVMGQDAALETGPAAGAKIVTTGAAELFGTEFGVGK